MVRSAHVQKKSTNGSNWKWSNSAVSGRKKLFWWDGITQKMVWKCLNQNFLTIIYTITFICQCQSRRSEFEFENIWFKEVFNNFKVLAQVTDVTPVIPHKSCLDFMGKTVSHSMKYTPPNDDNCKWCYCEDGHAEVNIQFDSWQFFYSIFDKFSFQIFHNY